MKEQIVKVKEQLSIILSEFILSLDALDEKFINELLDSRNSDPFDNNWVEANEALKEHSKNINANEKEELNKFLEEIRKEAFIKTIKASQSSDLAAYVSDDFEMIGTALILEFSNSFIASMLNSYTFCIVPGDLKQWENLERFKI
jgi:hypothetical protein